MDAINSCVNRLVV